MRSSAKEEKVLKKDTELKAHGGTIPSFGLALENESVKEEEGSQHLHLCEEPCSNRISLFSFISPFSTHQKPSLTHRIFAQHMFLGVLNESCNIAKMKSSMLLQHFLRGVETQHQA